MRGLEQVQGGGARDAGVQKAHSELQAPPMAWQAGCSLSLPLSKAVCPPFHPWELCWDPPVPSPLCEHTPTYSPLTHSPGFTMRPLF